MSGNGQVIADDVDADHGRVGGIMVQLEILAAIIPRGAIIHGQPGGVVVLVEAVHFVTEGDAIQVMMRAGGVTAAHFEAIAVAVEHRVGAGIRVKNIKAVAEGEAAVHHDHVGGHPEIPAVIRIVPGTATAKDVVRADDKFGGETVRIATDGRVVVAVGIAIQDEIGTGELGAAVGGDIQPRVAGAMDDTALDNVAAAGNQDAVMPGILDFQDAVIGPANCWKKCSIPPGPPPR